MAPATRAMCRKGRAELYEGPLPQTTRRRKAKSTRLDRLLRRMPAQTQKSISGLEESNAQYEAHIADVLEAKLLKAQPTCALCEEDFPIKKTGSRLSMPYSCPNERCTVRYCLDCKGKQLQHDHRCPFCRCNIGTQYTQNEAWNRIYTRIEQRRQRPLAPAPRRFPLPEWMEELQRGTRDEAERRQVRALTPRPQPLTEETENEQPIVPDVEAPRAGPMVESRPQHRWAGEHRRRERNTRSEHSQREGEPVVGLRPQHVDPREHRRRQRAAVTLLNQVQLGLYPDQDGL